MKVFLSVSCALLCALLMVMPLQAQQIQQGAVSGEQLLSDYPAFQQHYQDYQPTEQDLQAMAKLAGKELVVLLGTWCHDSEREVPKLLKLLKHSEVELAQVSFVAVDYQKQDKAGVAQRFNLKYTPTFIVLDEGQEIHRVVEKPKESLAADLTRF